MDLCSAVWLMIGTFLWLVAPAKGDVNESCVFMESCILPCSFQGGSDVVIHWFQLEAGILVHSFFNNKDQLTQQDQRFRNRTSLFKDQISGGNASLQLTGLQVQDQGRYKCYTSSNREKHISFINLRVDAPVGKVDLQQVGNRITCSSERIYPEPELTWSTSPPSNVTFKNQTEVQETEQLLYNIRSSLTVSDSDSDLIYSCSISTRRNKRRATLFKTSSVSRSSSATLHCTSSNTSLTGFSLTWRFNHNQIILTQTRADVSSSVSEGWSQQVKGVSESGSLMLQNLSPHHEGTYTCELSDAEETLITNTFLWIDSPENSTSVRDIIGWVVAAILFLAGTVVLVLHFKKKKDQQGNVKNSLQHCMNRMTCDVQEMEHEDINESSHLESGEFVTYSALRQSNGQEVETAAEDK